MRHPQGPGQGEGSCGFDLLEAVEGPGGRGGEAGLSKVWETVAEKECPKTLAAFLPEAGCDILKDKSLEKRTVAAICEKQHKVPTLECKIGLSHFWETR